MKRLDECGCGCGGQKDDCENSREGSMAKHDAMECADDAQAVANMIDDMDDLPVVQFERRCELILLPQLLFHLRDVLICIDLMQPRLSACFQDVAEQHSRFRATLRNLIKFPIAFVAGDKAIVAVKHAKALRHAFERGARGSVQSREPLVHFQIEHDSASQDDGNG